MYMLVFWGFISTLVQMVLPCSIYVGILFGLSMLVCLVQPCSMYVGMLSTAMFYVDTAMFYGVCFYFIPP